MLRKLHATRPSLNKLEICDLDDVNFVINENVAVDSPIEVVKADPNSNDCHDAFTQSLFGRSNDADMCCIWNRTYQNGDLISDSDCYDYSSGYDFEDSDLP